MNFSLGGTVLVRMDPRFEALNRRAAEAQQVLDEVEEERSGLLTEVVNQALGTTYESYQLTEGTQECPDPDDTSERRRARWPREVATDAELRRFFEEQEVEILAEKALEVPSPTGRCVYLDGDEDDCLFCGHPEERK